MGDMEPSGSCVTGILIAPETRPASEHFPIGHKTPQLGIASDLGYQSLHELRPICRWRLIQRICEALSAALAVFMDAPRFLLTDAAPIPFPFCISACGRFRASRVM